MCQVPALGWFGGWGEEFFSKNVTASSGRRDQGTGLPMLKSRLVLAEVFQQLPRLEAKSCQWGPPAAGHVFCHRYRNVQFWWERTSFWLSYVKALGRRLLTAAHQAAPVASHSQPAALCWGPCGWEMPVKQPWSPSTAAVPGGISPESRCKELCLGLRCVSEEEREAGWSPGELEVKERSHERGTSEGHGASSFVWGEMLRRQGGVIGRVAGEVTERSACRSVAAGFPSQLRSPTDKTHHRSAARSTGVQLCTAQWPPRLNVHWTYW